MKKRATDNSIPVPDVSIIVPTFKEAENIPLLVEEIADSLKHTIPAWELLIIDDDSRDGVAAACNELSGKGAPLKLVVRYTERGLSTAVLEGFTHARAPVFVVMDADLSHTPETIPIFYQEIQKGADFVIGSRYAPGGGTDDQWTVYRYLNSKLATLLARGLVSVSDPMSGFFALRRLLWEQCEHLSPVGYKIALELIVKGRPRNVKEVPIHFRARRIGESKLTLKQQMFYLYHLTLLYRYKWFSGRMRR